MKYINIKNWASKQLSQDLFKNYFYIYSVHKNILSYTYLIYEKVGIFCEA